MKGIVQNGQIVLAQPAAWPDGTEVDIQPIEPEERLGISEDEWPTDPEGMAEWRRWYESLEPLIFTAEERADTEEWRRKIKEYTIANMDRGIEDLFK